MPLTSNCDAIGIFSEEAFNKIIRQVMYQMPSTFNYATKKLITQNNFCSSIYADPVLIQMGKTVVTKIDKIPVFGSDSGLDFCMQVKDFKLDFHPNNTVVLPPELGDLSVQQFAMSMKINAGVLCGNSRFSAIKPKEVTLMKKKLSEVFLMDRGIVFNSFFRDKLSCFSMEAYAVLTIVNDSNFLSLKLIGLEIKDIEPVVLENIIEYYIKKVLQESVLPKMNIAISKLIFGLDSYASISPMPKSTAIPFNPSITNNKLTVYLKVQ